MQDNFTIYRILCFVLFCFVFLLSTLNISLYSLLAYMVSEGNSDVNLILVLLYCFALATLRISSLSLDFCSLKMICLSGMGHEEEKMLEGRKRNSSL